MNNKTNSKEKTSLKQKTVNFLKKNWKPQKIWAFGALLVGTTALAQYFNYLDNKKSEENLSFFSYLSSANKNKPQEVKNPTYKYGFMLDTFKVVEAEIPKNITFSELLSEQGIAFKTINNIVSNAKDVFNIRSIRAGKNFTLLKDQKDETPSYFIYEPNAYKYLVIDLQDEKVNLVERPTEMKVETASGMVESSLWNAMVDNGLGMELADKMEDALAWQVDFHHIQPGDQFKLVFEQEYVGGKRLGVGRLMAANCQVNGKEYKAYYYEVPNATHKGYFDEDGKPMKRTFLTSPVRFSRISSYFSKNRLHPILGYSRPHWGTDYAAPHGTPIMAVSDGTVLKAERKGGNGNYVTLSHYGGLQTTYLHMSRFAEGMRPGKHILQGQTIGYVGSTGLATGPHVCFRLTRNGQPMNHIKANLPPPTVMNKKQLDAFKTHCKSLDTQLSQVKVYSKKEIQAKAKDTLTLP